MNYKSRIIPKKEADFVEIQESYFVDTLTFPALRAYRHEVRGYLYSQHKCHSTYLSDILAHIPLAYPIRTHRQLHPTFALSYLFQRIVCRYVGQEGVGARCVVDVTTVVCEPIGNNYIGYTKLRIVTHNLVEGILCDGYMRCLIFYKHQGEALRIVHNRIATTRHAVE